MAPDPRPAPPPQIAKLVWCEGDELRVQSAHRHDWWFLAGLLAGLVVASLAVVTDGCGTAVVLAAFTLPVGVVGGWMLAQMRRELIVRGGQVRLSGPFAPELPRPEAIVIAGAVGRPQEVLGGVSHRGTRMGATPLASLELAERGDGWTHEGVSWLAARLASLLGVEVLDGRDEAKWRRWEQDPAYRAEVAFRNAIEDNREEFGAQHAWPAVPPDDLSVDLDGLSAMLHDGFIYDTVLRIDARDVSVGNQSIRLSRIRAAGVIYGKTRSKNTTYYGGSLVVFADGEQHVLTQLSVASDGGPTAGVLNWAAAEIERLAGLEAPPAREGDASDVPEALRAMRGSKRPE
ncbi:MAG: hypothetical protein H6737_23040 [Alphaproteobacteria bacterium]|nr:hypothetical protein [Alphaproteobacteria bacterium]